MRALILVLMLPLSAVADEASDRYATISSYVKFGAITDPDVKASVDVAHEAQTQANLEFQKAVCTKRDYYEINAPALADALDEQTARLTKIATDEMKNLDAVLARKPDVKVLVENLTNSNLVQIGHPPEGATDAIRARTDNSELLDHICATTVVAEE